MNILDMSYLLLNAKEGRITIISNFFLKKHLHSTSIPTK